MTIVAITVKISLVNWSESLLNQAIENYWKCSKIWDMSKLKNPTLNSISVWVHHSRIITLRKEISCLSIFLAWLAWANDELSQLIFWELSSRLGHVWLKCNWRKLSVTSKATELSSVKKTKFAKSIFNSSVVELLFRKS